jgi:hypothetical protein
MDCGRTGRPQFFFARVRRITSDFHAYNDAPDVRNQGASST